MRISGQPELQGKTLSQYKPAEAKLQKQRNKHEGSEAKRFQGGLGWGGVGAGFGIVLGPRDHA